MSTFMANKANIERKWYILDAAGKPLGKTAVRAADLLRGKGKVTYTPHADCGANVIIINAGKAILSPAVVPAIAFLVVAALNFTTGSVWGITAVTVPILLPLAFSIGANPLLVMGAIVSGATLGSHACFYSDATVLTSSCCKMENMDHALSQLPYSLCAAGLSAAGYLVCGLLM